MSLLTRPLLGPCPRQRTNPRPRASAGRTRRPLLEPLEDRTLLSHYEVWAIDQSDTRPDGGGNVYVYQGESLRGPGAASAVPQVIDLGGAVRDMSLAQTGTAPRRPHMMFFSPTHSHAIIAFVTTGHVLFLNAATRQPAGIVDVGVQAHAAVPTPDGRFVIVANQNGKLLQRITTNYATNTFTLDNAATLNLASGTTPSGALREDPNLRPDNAPICPVIDSSGRFAFVTLRGGGMFVVDTTTTPLSIVAEYDRNMVNPNGCGGTETAGKMYINAGGGTPANPVESDLYMFTLSAFTTTPRPPNTPAPKVVFSHDSRGFVDSHGTALVPFGGEHRYLWAADRAANLVVVVDTRTDTVVNEFSLAGSVSGDPTPDLMEASPDGQLVFFTLRGPTPLTGNAPGVGNAVGSTPGLGVIQVQWGVGGVFRAVAPISNVVNGVNMADPHGMGVRLTGLPAGPCSVGPLADDAERTGVDGVSDPEEANLVAVLRALSPVVPPGSPAAADAVPLATSLSPSPLPPTEVGSAANAALTSFATAMSAALAPVASADVLDNLFSVLANADNAVLLGEEWNLAGIR